MVHSIISDPLDIASRCIENSRDLNISEWLRPSLVIKGLGVDRGPCVTNIIVRKTVTGLFSVSNDYMAVVSFLVCDTHHIHIVVKYIESLVIPKASEQEQGKTQMGGNLRNIT